MYAYLCYPAAANLAPLWSCPARKGTYFVPELLLIILRHHVLAISTVGRAK